MSATFPQNVSSVAMVRVAVTILSAQRLSLIDGNDSSIPSSIYAVDRCTVLRFYCARSCYRSVAVPSIYHPLGVKDPKVESEDALLGVSSRRK